MKDKVKVLINVQLSPGEVPTPVELPLDPVIAENVEVKVLAKTSILNVDLNLVTSGATPSILPLYEAKRKLVTPLKVEEKVPDVKEVLYEIRAIAGKGRGLFAVRDIKIGEVILSEKPMVLMPDSIFSLDDMDKLENWLDRQLNKLPSQQRETFFNLADSRSPDGDKTNLGIFFTNDMDFDGDAGLFPTIAMANHSCQPNSDFVTKITRGVQEIIAVENISAGEEITLSYLPASCEGSDVRKVRQDYVIEWYGFRCVCSTCTLQDSALRENETLRQNVRKIQNTQFNLVPLTDLEQHLDNLSKIKAKIPHQLEFCQALLHRAELENNHLVAAKVRARAYLLSEIVDAIGEKQFDDWREISKAQWVSIDRRGCLFPPQNE